ncbi:2-isopropylmalate synthase [Aristaeella hokkaidonensis]|uniref:2-isopropylmalate synthase n=1 Tax=Aristaeella hokkaidonensis TaxID=3046382 RepID=A0AC61MUZ6_9FIRM|nr:2-isopropylmalate synthase [Aristaeella hokkaidonensis]QUC66249.1 2-isopropylmalate synthase [Aristaeella hokkaidonensis]SNT95414.1 Isopropylmalate/homocitrate/citramalate synthases [Aristaeella hokkaidonensis]
MLSFDNTVNLLMQSKYRYSLQDVAEPNLYREIYDYDHVPKVAFNLRHVPMQMPDHIWMTDTTFRDGQQSVSPFTPEQILHLFKLMSRLGGPNGMVRQSEFFLYTENDQKALHLCQDAGLKFPEITTWIRANEKDFELVKQAGVAETGVLVSCSDYHIFNKMHLTRKQAMDKYLGIVKAALEYGIRPRCHFEDITRADFYGFVVPFAGALMDLSRESGIPIKIRACDTMGYGVSYPGTALPRSVQGIIYGLRHYAEVPSEQLEWHGHNDFYKVVSNAATAWLHGCSSINCSLLGIGERTGNCPLEAMAIEYQSLRGDDGGMDLTAITEIADYMEREIGLEISPRQPFVGRHFNVTRAGIHADGMLKDEEIYNIFNTAKLLNRPASVAVDSRGGTASIAHWLNNYFRLTGDNTIDKNDPLIVNMRARVDDLYAKGRNTVMGDEELEVMVRRCDQNRYEKLLFHKSK